MKSTLLMIGMLWSASGHAGTKVQFDVQAIVIDSESTQAFIHKQTYTGEFQPAPDQADEVYSEMLMVHEDLPLIRPSTGEALGLNFSLQITHLINAAPDGKAYNIDISFGPGQPINVHTRWGTTYLRTLDSFAGLSINAEQIPYPKKDGTALVSPALIIRNFRILESVRSLSAPLGQGTCYSAPTCSGFVKARNVSASSCSRSGGLSWKANAGGLCHIL